MIGRINNKNNIGNQSISESTPIIVYVYTSIVLQNNQYDSDSKVKSNQNLMYCLFDIFCIIKI